MGNKQVLTQSTFVLCGAATRFTLSTVSTHGPEVAYVCEFVDIDEGDQDSSW